MKYILAVLVLVAVFQGRNLRSAKIIRKQQNDSSNQIPEYYTSTAYPMSRDPSDTAPWFDEFDGIQEAFLFPGSHYLEELIHDHYANNWMDKDDIKDYFELSDCDVDDLKKRMNSVYKVTEDPEGTALLATRFVMKGVFRQKMRCPASVIDMYLVRAMYSIRQELFSVSDGEVYAFLVEMAPLINPELQNYAEDIAARGVQTLDNMIFNSTIEFLVGFGLRDIAFTSHSLYRGLEDYFRYNMKSSPDYYTPSMLDTIRGFMWEIRCYDVNDMIDAHLQMINMMREEFGFIETAHVCVKVEEFLREYLNMIMPDMEHHMSPEQVGTVCERITEIITEIMSQFDKYESVLYSRSIGELKDFLRDALSEPEWMVLSEAATRLGFYDYY